MYQIDNSTAAQAIPASTTAGSKGYFTDGNPATGTPATILPAEFMNMLMMENLNVLAAAGIPPDKSKFNQLAQAISAITGSNLTWANLGGKPSTISGFGIMDAYTKAQMDSSLAGKANNANTLSGYGINDAYTKTQTDSALSGKANKATTLSGYGITDARKSDDSVFNNLIVARASITLPQASVIDFNNAADTQQLYRIASGTPAWVFYAFPTLATPIAAITVLSSNGQVSLAARPIFAGNTPWDSGNLNPNLYVANDFISYAGLASDDITKPYFRRKSDNSLVLLATADKGVPPGAICAFPSPTPPSGWIKANGAILSISTYPALFAAIGATFGGNGTTTFGVPDLRAEVIRGFDDGRGIDTGRAFGTVQTDALQGHNHVTYYSTQGFTGSGGNSYVMFTSGGGNNTSGLTDSVRNPISDGSGGAVRTASETRSRNVSLLYCIKF